MTTPASNVWMGLMLRAWTQQMRNRVHQSVRGSKLMVSVIVTFMIGYWIFFTDLFWEGIHFLMGIPAIGEILLNRMFYLLFAFLMSMLVSSCVIVGYTTFFKNRETQWMLTLPIPHQDVFRWKFLETTVLASWAFLFLSGPLLLAYALYLRLGWGFLLGVGFIYFPFALICSVMGTWILLFVVRMFHHRSGRKALFALAVALLAATIWTFKPVDVEQLHEIQLTPLLNMLMKNSRHVAQPFLPSYWLGASILSLSSHLWAKLIFFMLVTLSHCLLAMWSIWFLTGKLFYLNSSLVVDRVLHGSTVSRKPRAFAEWTGKLLLAFIPGVRKQVRAILLKDWIVFWRDPAQWTQFVIFFGLLGIYFLNLKSLHQPNLDDRFWINVIAFLNLTSLSLILATLTTRFIFPQFSLEGRRLWLVTMAPVTLFEVIWSKFWTSAIASGTLTLGLMLLSFHSLRLEWFMRGLIAFSIVGMSMGLSSLAISLGVLFPNLKQDNPARIVSGFGGTLCLVLSLAYIVVVILAEAIPVHFLYVQRAFSHFRFASVLTLVYIMMVLVHAAVTAIPLALAARQLRTLEL